MRFFKMPSGKMHLGGSTEEQGFPCHIKGSDIWQHIFIWDSDLESC